jgi:hypothetical protein
VAGAQTCGVSKIFVSEYRNHCCEVDCSSSPSLVLFEALEALAVSSGGNPSSFFRAKKPQRIAKRTRKMLTESQLFLTVLGRRTWEVSEINGRTAKKRKAKAMIGKRRMSSGGERSGDADERPRRGMEVVGGGSAFSCSRALSPGSWF